MYYFLFVTIPLILGFVLDLIFGEPKKLRHPVVIIGGIIAKLEKGLNTENMEAENTFAADAAEAEERARSARAGGVITAAVTCAVTVAVAIAIPLSVYCGVYFLAAFVCNRAVVTQTGFAAVAPAFVATASCMIVLGIMCWLMLATRSLYTESMKVYRALIPGEDIEAARFAVSMIVGRDTAVLDREGIIRAAVETVAENTSDGVTAPMFWTCVLGVPGLFLYKAINTMDSMIAYKNDRYMNFGRCAAKLDDVANWLPSRITALLMILAAYVIPGFSGRDALRIWKRDRRKHASPNSAQTESVCAGALGVRLAGPAVYFGVIHSKSHIGDAKRGIKADDIKKANLLMLSASVLMLAAASVTGSVVLMLTWLRA